LSLGRINGKAELKREIKGQGVEEEWCGFCGTKEFGEGGFDQEQKIQQKSHRRTTTRTT
jgi:hypothetical protein